LAQKKFLVAGATGATGGYAVGRLLFAGTNALAAQISGRPPMTIEEFVAKNRAAFL